ncbi:MAG: Deoxyuridine 5'-triphosphate nucleotidohydrolase [Candidatus Dichloromethanomonas elyunquensis]|nr:MAG: Deoxyuridine 5'-triphosphate nucleotidohydrolase [Candidatus Dichloromethanomonas elyunquensis]
MLDIKIKKLDRTGNAKIPEYATPGAAGADLYASLNEDMIIKPGERVVIPTGIALELPGPQFVALVFARSGLASKKGLALSNGVGVIDSDFRGEIKVLSVNLGQEAIVIQNGDRIAQMLFTNAYQASFLEVEELGDTLRGEGGFGSTGRK